MGNRPNIFQTFIEKSRFDILMDYFDEDVRHPLLDEDESDSENMTSNVTVVWGQHTRDVCRNKNQL